MKDNLNDNLIRTYRERLEIAEIYEKKMHAIIDAGKTINFNDNINEIMDSMLELAAKITNSGFASAALMGKSGRILFGYSIPGEKPGALPADTDFIREKGIGGILMRTKIPYICNVPAVDKIWMKIKEYAMAYGILFRCRYLQREIISRDYLKYIIKPGLKSTAIMILTC